MRRRPEAVADDLKCTRTGCLMLGPWQTALNSLLSRWSRQYRAGVTALDAATSGERSPQPGIERSLDPRHERTWEGHESCSTRGY